MTDRFVGTWRLVSFVRRGADGHETTTYGSEPHGILMYDSGGRMSVQIASADRRPFTSGNSVTASLEELKEAFDGYFGYFGRYTVNETAGTVTHHIEASSDPNFIGTDQRRFFRWQNDWLVLSTPPEGAGAHEATYIATWERQP